MKNSIGLNIASLLFTATVAFAQFNPGPNPIPAGTTTGAQTLSGGSGIVNAGGAISTGGATLALSMTGTSSLVNNGTIEQTGSGRAIDSNAGIASLSVTNNGLISAVSTDAFRVNTDSTVSLTNGGVIRVTAGGQAIDWAAITSAGNTLNNLTTGTISAVGQDAVRPGANGVVNNGGAITATPTGTTDPTGSDGIQADGSGVVVTNLGAISGRHGITGGAPGFSITVQNNGGTISAVNGSGINIDDLGTMATVTNAAGATIQGGVTAEATNGDGDGIDVDGVLMLTNSGDILGRGAKGVGSDLGPNNTEGLAAGGGTIINNATGRIIGTASGPGAPNGDPTRPGNGILIDNSSMGNAIAVTNITNSGLIQGVSGVGIRIFSAFANIITNNAGGMISGAGANALGAAIQTGDGNDTVNNAGAIVGDNGSAIDLQGGNNSLNILGGAASIMGNISGGVGGTNGLSIDPGNGNSFSYAGAISNFNAVEIASGTVTFSGANTYSGTTTVSGGTLLVQNATGNATGTSAVAVNNGGTLGGNGAVGDVAVSGGGTVAPGTSAGRLTVNGNYAQAGALAIEIGGTTAGTQHDQLVVSGQATLGGTLNLSLISGFMPSVGDTFQIITSGSATGNFATINSSGFTVSSGVTNGGRHVNGDERQRRSHADADPHRDADCDADTYRHTHSYRYAYGNAGLVHSTRQHLHALRVETGDNVLIGGFIVTGTQPKRVIVRAIGPSLPVGGKLADPILELRDVTGALIASNDNWRSTQEAEIIASQVPPTSDLESAIVATLPANSSNYTAIVRGVNNGTGIALVEAYDLDQSVDSRLANISTRGLVQTSDNVLIAGTIVLGTAPQRVLIRAIGPSLPVAGKLADPTLELRDGNGVLLQANDNWRSTQEAEIIGTTVPPTSDLESALVATLPAGGARYTAIVRGANNGTGVGLVEIFGLPSGMAAITSPAPGMTVGSAFMIEATAAPSRGTITSVSFYDGGTLIGTTTTAPYRFAWTSASPGNHALTAVALDSGNAMSASPPVNVTVIAGAGSLTRGPYLQKAAPTQMTIRWRNTLYDLGRVRYGTVAGTLDQTVDEAAAPAAQFNHEVTLTGLTPNTTYFYSVGSGADTLAPAPPDNGLDYTFNTPPTAGTAINTRIWVLGDAGTAGYGIPAATANQTAVRDAFYAFTGARTPNLVLELGDNAYNSGLDNEFQVAVFDMYRTMLRKTPFWSCLGNHETGQATAFVDTYPYFDIYTLPTAGEAGGVASGTEHYYSFDYGNIHFIALDSMTANRAVDDPNTPGVNEDGPMAAWLRTDLQSTTATWIICFFHHPPYTKGSHNSDTENGLIEMRQNFLPILEAGGVDLTLSGHSHSYERSFLLDGHYGLSTTLTNAMKINGGDGRPAGNGAYIKPLAGSRSHQGRGLCRRGLLRPGHFYARRIFPIPRISSPCSTSAPSSST